MPGTITTDLTTIKAAEATADYLVLGTYASARALNDDIKVEGTNAINGRVSANTAWALASTPSANLDLSGGAHVYMWIRNLTWPSTDTKANGGIGISISSDATPTLTGTSPSNGPTNSKTWYLAGSDTDVVTGWTCYVVDPNSTPDLTLGTPAMNSVDRVGLRAKVTGTVSNKTLNIQDDVIRYGTGVTVNDGTSGSPVGFVDIFTTDSSNTNAWGIITRQSGIYFLAGKVRVGTTGQSAVTFFKDTGQTVVCPFFPVASTHYEFVLAGAASFGTTFQLGNYAGSLASDGVTIGGAASGSSFAVWNLTADATNTTCLLYACTFSELRRASFRSTSEIRSCVFDTFGDITAGGALFDSCSFLNLRTTAPISATYGVSVTTTAATLTNSVFVNCATALFWNVNTDLDGKLDDSSFTSGGTGHAIELGANTPATITIRDVTFSGYGADGTTDAAIYNNSGKAITINIAGTGNSPTVRNGSGASTTVVAGTVSATVKTVDSTGANLANVRVLVFATSGGPFPANASVTITRSGATATVVHTAHGMATNDKVVISGATQLEYNGVFTITKIDNDSYSYTVSGSPATPATGTITSTFAVLSGLTDTNGEITMSRVFPSNQPVSGRARKSSAAPYYKTAGITGTVNSATGFSATVQMISDE